MCYLFIGDVFKLVKYNKVVLSDFWKLLNALPLLGIPEIVKTTQQQKEVWFA
jgi:hypothetical protein